MTSTRSHQRTCKMAFNLWSWIQINKNSYYTKTVTDCYRAFCILAYPKTLPRKYVISMSKMTNSRTRKNTDNLQEVKLCWLKVLEVANRCNRKKPSNWKNHSLTRGWLGHWTSVMEPRKHDHINKYPGWNLVWSKSINKEQKHTHNDCWVCQRSWQKWQHAHAGRDLLWSKER